ncbi:MAG: 1-acyl-sn-glycerol-3-phosphate acyltransferase [Bacteroidales bacterium]|nr:1-acyl-sn-glycerol-3-phosphate acyltransferase [Bacteroidales bacterium]
MENSKVRKQQIPMESVYPIHISSDYVFIRNDYFYLFFSFIAYYLFFLVLGIGFFRILGRHKVYGRKNLRPLRGRGYISVANHCHLFDTVLTGSALLPRRPWYASVQRNFEAPYYRKMFRILRGFPIPSGSIGLKRIIPPVVKAVSKGKIIHMFPEEELWHLCQDIDHFQKGAFFLAHQANCPIVPIVHMFKPRRFFGKTLSKNILSITTIIGQPIYPYVGKEEGKMVDRRSVQEMCDCAQLWMKQKLEEFHQNK